MLHDDEGDNISEKNGQYCELTAQYWAWKNLDADYVGLCHYRRFLCFADGEFELDERNQIQAGMLDEENKVKYGLTDEALMQKTIEDNDCVVGDLEDITGIYTPKGEQKTVYEHWAKHDRALINTRDLDMLMQLIDRKYPQFSHEAHEYMNGRYFLGYNCFVMKKALFDEMCAYEFDILSEMERYVDFTHYNQTLTRVYGFMAEILYSIYIYHLENNGAKVKHLPLVYFNVTDKLETFDLAPIQDAIPVVFIAHYKVFEAVLDVTLRSFLAHINPDRKYDIIILNDQIRTYIKKSLQKQAAECPNVTLRFIDAISLGIMIDDHIGFRKEITGNKVEIVDPDPRALMPWLLTKYPKIILLEWNLLFRGSIDELWDMDMQGKMIAATPDLGEQACVNNPYSNRLEYDRDTLKMKDPFDFFETSVMVMDLEKMRDERYHDRVIAFYQREDYAIRHMDVLNAVYEGQTLPLDYKWNYPVVMNDWRKSILPQAPLAIYRQYQQASKDVCIEQYDKDDMWNPIGSDTDVEFWRLARQGNFYEVLLSSMVNRGFEIAEDNEKRNFSTIVFSALFPAETKRRAKIEKACPEGSRRRRILNHMS